MELYYGIELQNYVMQLYYGMMLRKYITRSYYGIILPNDIMESYHGIIFMKRISGMPGTSSEPPGIPGSPWHAPRTAGDALVPPGTPLGPPRDASGTHEDLQGPLWTTKTAIARQIYSARSSGLLCSVLLVGTHRLKDSTGPFCL